MPGHAAVREERRQNAVPPPANPRQTGTLRWFSLVAPAAAPASVAAPAAAAVAAASAPAASVLARLRLVDGQAAAAGLRPVQRRDGRLRLLVAGHLYEAEAL